MKLNKLRKVLDWKDWLALAIGGGVVFGLGLSNITRWSVWFDEAFSERIAQHSFIDIARFTIADVHPPLYYFVLKGWMMVFGNSEVAIRSLSLVFLAIAVVVAYIFLRYFFSRRSAILSLLFLALSPMLFRYGIEARMYTMEVSIVVIATAALAQALTANSRKWWVAYGVVMALGMLTHYLTLTVWVAQGIWLAMNYRQKTFMQTIRHTLTTGYGLAIKVALAITALWLPFFVWQIIHIQGGGFWIEPVSLRTLPDFISNIYTYQSAGSVQAWPAFLIMFVIAVSVFCVRKAYQNFNGIKRRVYSLLIVSAVVPPLLLILGSMPPLRPSFVDRYLLASIAVWFMVTGVAFAHTWRVPRLAVPTKIATLLLACLLGAGVYYVQSVGNMNRDNGSIHTMRRAMQITNEMAEGNEPIIIDSPWRYLEASYYQQEPHGVYFASDDATKIGAYEMLRAETTHKIVDMGQFSKNNRVAWYITAQSRNETSVVPADWQQVATYLVDEPSQLRVIKMIYSGE